MRAKCACSSDNRARFTSRLTAGFVFFWNHIKEATVAEDLTRKDFIEISAGAGALALGADALEADASTTTAVTTLTVNGMRHSLTLDPRTTLLDAIREQMRLTGTKKGCDRGECGACTVHVGGRCVLSCLSLAVSHDGDTITTIEGVSNNVRWDQCNRPSSSTTPFSAASARLGKSRRRSLSSTKRIHAPRTRFASG